MDNQEQDNEALQNENSNDQAYVSRERLNEVLKINKDLEKRLKSLEKEQQEQLEEQMKEQGRYKELAEQHAKELAELKPKAMTVDSYEATLVNVLETQMAEIPENMRGLIPDELSTQQKLNWLSRNKALLLKPRPQDIGAGKQGGSAPETLDLTPEELETAKRFGMAPEEYAKYK
jgi:phage I-like protein